MPELRIHLKTIGDRSTRCCEVIGCSALVLFFDETNSKTSGRELWVCWLHGQLALREGLGWWPDEGADLVAREV